MKFLVDQMPYWGNDCPFYDPITRMCKLDSCQCGYFFDHRRDFNDCHWLTTADVEALDNYIPRDVIDKSDYCGYVSGACPKCGERLYGVGRSVKFCPYCGQKLKGGSKE